MSDDHVVVNRASWDEDAPNWVERGRRSWSSEPFWGIWGNPESELHLLPDLTDLDAVELGGGTGYGSAWMKRRRAASVVGLDNSAEQLATARLLQGEFDLRFPLVHADAERVPFKDGSFDFALSEYGAAIWCDPYRWIPESARILRPGGRLVFVGGTALMMLCFRTDDDTAPAETTLHRDHFGMHRFEWHKEDGTVDGIEFHLTHGDMIRLLRFCGFEIEDLVEVQAPADATSHVEADVPLEWARRWPSVEVVGAKGRLAEPLGEGAARERDVLGCRARRHVEEQAVEPGIEEPTRRCRASLRPSRGTRGSDT